MSISKFGFNTGFMRPADVKWISDKISEVSEKEKDVNIERVAQLLWSFKATGYTVRGKGVIITHKLFDPTKGMGSVNITGKEIYFTDTELFTTIAKIATNFEVFPKTNGDVQINFTFHGLRL